jgi:hypothetical protein
VADLFGFHCRQADIDSQSAKAKGNQMKGVTMLLRRMLLLRLLSLTLAVPAFTGFGLIRFSQ